VVAIIVMCLHRNAKPPYVLKQSAQNVKLTKTA